MEVLQKQSKLDLSFSFDFTVILLYLFRLFEKLYEKSYNIFEIVK